MTLAEQRPRWRGMKNTFDFIYLFIYSIFNYAFSFTQDYIALNERIIGE
jgi:hypothetical protein